MIDRNALPRVKESDDSNNFDFFSNSISFMNLVSRSATSSILKSHSRTDPFETSSTFDGSPFMAYHNSCVFSFGYS